MSRRAAATEAANGKDRLVKVAMRLFADRGFDGVTVRDIAQAAGASVGLINHHFGSKEGLREAVDRYFMGQFEEILAEPPISRAAVQDDEQAVDLTVARTEQWITRHIDDWDLLKAYMRRALLEGSEWGSVVFERFYDVVRRSIDRRDADGGLRQDVDRLWLPLLIMYMELGTLLLEPYVERMLGKSGFDRVLWRRRHRAYTDLIFRGTRPMAGD